MDNQNSQLSEQLKVRLLEPGESATFVLLNKDKKEKGRDEPSCPDTYAVAKKETIFDPFLKRKVVLQAIESYEPEEIAGGQTRLKPILSAVVFTKGEVTLTDEDNEKYIAMMRSKKNSSNPWAGRGRKVFKLKDSKKEVYDALKDEDLKFQAEKLVRDSDWNVRRAIVQKLNSSPVVQHRVTGNMDDLQAVLLQLVRRAQEFPKKVIMSSTDIKAKCRVYISDGLFYRLLIWEDDTQTWSLYLADAKVKEKAITELCKVDANEDRHDKLVSYLTSTEGVDQYKILVNRLQAILRGISTPTA